jgi:membrane protein
MRGPQLGIGAAAGRMRQALLTVPAVRFGVALGRRAGDDDLTGMAAEMAYSFLFALFPLLLVFAAIIGMIGSVLGRQDILNAAIAAIAPFLPGPVAKLFEDAILDLVTERAAAIALVGLLLALWGAASGVGALMKGLDRAYGVARARPSLRREAVRAAATLLVTPLGLALLLVSVVAHALTTWLGALTGSSEVVAVLVAALQIPLTFVVFFAGMTLVYWGLPAVPQRYRDVIPGSLVAAIGWSAITQAFGVYIADMDEYSAAYGIFGAAIAFLLWLYLVGLVILIGAEVNALLSSPGRRSWAADARAHV